jgi:hypothetical protein
VHEVTHDVKPGSRKVWLASLHVRQRPGILYVTDPGYPAQGREYGGEDRMLVRDLEEVFSVRTCLPGEAVGLMGDVDVVVVRNSGPVAAYPDAYAEFRERALRTGQPVYNELAGKADMVGKQYLPDLFAAGYPVIPTVQSAGELGLLPTADRYVVKPLLGADSAGLYVATADDLAAAPPAGMLIQPRVEIVEEISYYFVDDAFVYALRTSAPQRRWDLVPHEPDAAELAFARRFIEWNDIRHGIQRVDACRTAQDELLLVELEDLNPFLSLDRTTDAVRRTFVGAFVAAIERLVG